MESEIVVSQVSKRVYLEVTILRILAVLAVIIGIYLELKGIGALVETLIIAFGLFIISENRLTCEILRSEIKSASDKIIDANRSLLKEKMGDKNDATTL
jgi:ABC-type amino acid transport system permease subunit